MSPSAVCESPPPETRASTRRWTMSAIAVSAGSRPWVAMWRRAGLYHSAAQQARTAVRKSCSLPTPRKLSNWPAKLESARSSTSAEERTTASLAASSGSSTCGVIAPSINPSFRSSAQRLARARSSEANTSRAVASRPSAASWRRYARASTAQPPGTGRPARPRAARVAALGPKRFAALACGALRGTTRSSILALRIDHQPQDAARVALVLLEGRGGVGERVLGADEAVDVDRSRGDQLDARVHVLRRERARADDADLAEVDRERGEAAYRLVAHRERGEAPAGPQHVHRRAQRLCAARRVDHHVGSAPAGEALDLVDRAFHRRLDDVMRAHALGHVELPLRARQIGRAHV